MRDYREKLQELMAELNEQEGLTRYRIARRSGITEQTISNVLHKRRNLSIDALERLLISVGYEVAFVKSATPPSNGHIVGAESSVEPSEARMAN